MYYVKHNGKILGGYSSEFMAWQKARRVGGVVVTL